jgi:hypothetical protein
LMMYMYIIAPGLSGVAAKWRAPRDHIEAAVSAPETPLFAGCKFTIRAQSRQK